MFQVQQWQKTFFVFVIIFQVLNACKIQKTTLTYEGNMECQNFYYFGKNYKTKLSKVELLNHWKSSGYSIRDTTISNGKWTLYQTKVYPQCDTIEFINFQLFHYAQTQKIYLHGICMKHEKKPRKKQKELRTLQKEIEKEFIQNVLLPRHP